MVGGLLRHPGAGRVPAHPRDTAPGTSDVCKETIKPPRRLPPSRACPRGRGAPSPHFHSWRGPAWIGSNPFQPSWRLVGQVPSGRSAGSRLRPQDPGETERRERRASGRGSPRCGQSCDLRPAPGAAQAALWGSILWGAQRPRAAGPSRGQERAGEGGQGLRLRAPLQAQGASRTQDLPTSTPPSSRSGQCGAWRSPVPLVSFQLREPS